MHAEAEVIDVSHPLQVQQELARDNQWPPSRLEGSPVLRRETVRLKTDWAGTIAIAMTIWQCLVGASERERKALQVQQIRSIT